MSRSEITCGEPECMSLPVTQNMSQSVETAERRAPREVANAWLGALVVTFTAFVFYGGIAACIWYFR